jgi:hypothetical protein
MGRSRNSLTHLIGKPERNRPVGRPRREGDIKMHLTKRNVVSERGLSSCGSRRRPMASSCEHDALCSTNCVELFGYMRVMVAP